MRRPAFRTFKLCRHKSISSLVKKRRYSVNESDLDTSRKLLVKFAYNLPIGTDERNQLRDQIVKHRDKKIKKHKNEIDLAQRRVEGIEGQIKYITETVGGSTPMLNDSYLELKETLEQLKRVDTFSLGFLK